MGAPPIAPQTDPPFRSQAVPSQSQALANTQTSPKRPTHLTTRSITEIQPPNVKLHRHHHHYPQIHKHKHSESQTGFQNQDREQCSKSEGVTPEESRNVSRRGSMLEGWEGGARMSGGLSKNVVRDGEVAEEREKGELRATELRNALLGLNSLSNNTTRRLDNTYYSVLEKLSVLQGTITSMKELASMARQLNGEFEMESGEVISDVNGLVESYEEFEEQEKRIAALAERVHTGRERIKTLGDRVDLVKTRVEGWEEAEAEWKEKTRKRFRLMWTVMGIVGAILVVIMIFQNMPTKAPEHDTGKALNASGLLGKIPDMEASKNGSRQARKQVVQVLEGLRQPDELDEDPRLRVFDEL